MNGNAESNRDCTPTGLVVLAMKESGSNLQDQTLKRWACGGLNGIGTRNRRNWQAYSLNGDVNLDSNVGLFMSDARRDMRYWLWRVCRKRHPKPTWEVFPNRSLWLEFRDYRLHLSVLLKAILAQFPTDSRLLEASKWGPRIHHVLTIDPYRASADPI